MIRSRDKTREILRRKKRGRKRDRCRTADPREIKLNVGAWRVGSYLVAVLGLLGCSVDL
jgi:hypothetical protein